MFTLMTIVLASVFNAFVSIGMVEYDEGRLSTYAPNDGFNSGLLSCGRKVQYTATQNHIAYRKWRKMGCGRKVLVCTDHTKRCVLSKVFDSGPWGQYRGRLQRAVEEGRWRVWTDSTKAPKGWKWRGAVDLSINLWKQLGRPKFLSKVRLYFLPKGEVGEKLAPYVKVFFGYQEKPSQNS